LYGVGYAEVPRLDVEVPERSQNPRAKPFSPNLEQEWPGVMA